MGRAPCCDKENVKRGPWSPEEDAKLKSFIEENGYGGNWIALPQKIGLKRCGKSCRLRWLNYLRPNIRHGGFSEEEDRIICSLYVSIGSRWSIIAAQLPGRTDNDIKNYWNTKLKKKLLGKQRKDLDHHFSSMGRKLKKLTLESNIHGVERSFNSIPINQDQVMIPHYPELDEYSSMRSLLMKVEGAPINIYDHQSMYYPHPSFPTTEDLPQLSNQLMNLVASNGLVSNYNGDFDGLMDNNASTSGAPHAMMNGLDFMAWQRMMMINNNASGSDVTSVGDQSQANSWGDMSSLVPLPMETAFDEFKYNGE